MQYYLDWVDQIAIFAIYAMSLNLLMGYAGQLSVAHAAFGAVGGYTAGYLSAHEGVGFVGALACGIAAAGLVGMLVSLPALRLSREYLVLLTLATATIITSVATSVDIFGGALGLQGIQVPSLFGKQFLRPADFTATFLVLMVVVLAICWRLGESPFGRVMRGIRDDETVARSLGKNVFAYKIVIFGITSGMAGLAGALMAFYNQLAIPGQYGFTTTMSIIAMVIVGGIGNLWGAIVGVILVVILQPILEKAVHLPADKASLVRLIVYGAIVVGTLVVRPQGLIPERLRGAQAKRRTRSELLGLPAPAARPGALAESPLPERHASAGEVAVPVALAPRLPASGEELARGTPILTVERLSKSFGGIYAARDLSFELREGSITGLIGPNGAGKTTVFNLLTGAIRPESGTIRLHGKDITGWTPNRIAREGIVRSFQDVRIYPRISALENVAIGVPRQPGERASELFLLPHRVWRGERRTREKAFECLEFVGLAGQAHLAAGELSFGDQKLIALARILATDAKLLLLDEPASGIDSRSVDRMLGTIESIRAHGKTVCIVEHNLQVVERIAETIYFMESGSIVASGTMQELVAQPRLADVYFGMA